MKVELQDHFVQKLNRILAYISQDKPSSARIFKKDLLKQIESLSKYPYRCRQSIHFNRREIRDLIFKGYTIVYVVQKDKNRIVVFGLIKHQEGPDKEFK